MKLNLNQEIHATPTQLWSILSDTAQRKSWIPFFECEKPELLKEGLVLDTSYSFVNHQPCKEQYFRIIPEKEIALNVESAKGLWTVFVLLKETDAGVEMIIMAELKSSTWWPSLLSWLEAGKLELNAREILKSFKQFVEKQLVETK